MKRKIENWSVEKLHKERTRISFPEYQRQPNLWSVNKKALLIDSILRDIDIPKLYFNKTKDGTFEVIDGQQRLWAIWQFLDGEYPAKLNGKTNEFANLHSADREKITKFELQVAVLEEADDKYLRELFIRLQLGLLLITGEKLHAASGQMKEFVFKKLVSLRFVKELGIPNRRYSKETLCAQICINSFNYEKLNAFSRTRYEDLQYFFKEYEHPQGNDLKFFQEKMKKICGIMELLWKCFGRKSGELRNRSYILSVYLFLEELYKNQGVLLKGSKVFHEFCAYHGKALERRG